MISKVYNSIVSYINDNEKRDVYQVEFKIQSKTGILHFSCVNQINTKKGFFPTRRILAKLYGEHISNSIKSLRKTHGSVVVVEIKCKIGTFKRKHIEK